MTHARSTALAALLASILAADPSFAQETPKATPAQGSTDSPGITILAEPYGVRLRFRGGLDMDGVSPLELPASATGRFSLAAKGEGIARTQGAFRIAAVGSPAELLSEPPGMSASLLVRSLSFPGFASYAAKREPRGIVLATAGAGAIFGAARSHLRYRDRLDEFGAYASDRVVNERRARDSWVRYGAAVWGVSALDYMIRPRFTTRESTPARLSILVPETTRGGSLWRSLLVPGAGQEFAGHRFRGSAWLGAALAAGAGIVVANVAVERKQTEVDWGEALVDSAGPSERPVRERELEVLRNDLQEAEDARRGSVIALFGIWAANLLDAAVMTVIKPPPTQPARLQASVPITPDGPTLVLRYRF
jgi:hypothetical protein